LSCFRWPTACAGWIASPRVGDRRQQCGAPHSRHHHGACAGAVNLGKLQDEAEKEAAEEAADAFKPLLAKLKEALKDKAEDVRVTTRLARMLKQAGQTAPEVKPVLEVNAEHALVEKLDVSVHFHDLTHILFDQALLAESGLPADPTAYVKRVNALLV
jgi:molecular chaperone HtpG